MRTMRLFFALLLIAVLALAASTFVVAQEAPTFSQGDTVKVIAPLNVRDYPGSEFHDIGDLDVNETFVLSSINENGNERWGYFNGTSLQPTLNGWALLFGANGSTVQVITASPVQTEQVVSATATPGFVGQLTATPTVGDPCANGNPDCCPLVQNGGTDMVPPDSHDSAGQICEAGNWSQPSTNANASAVGGGQGGGGDLYVYPVPPSTYLALWDSLEDNWIRPRQAKDNQGLAYHTLVRLSTDRPLAEGDVVVMRTPILWEVRPGTGNGPLNVLFELRRDYETATTLEYDGASIQDPYYVSSGGQSHGLGIFLGCDGCIMTIGNSQPMSVNIHVCTDCSADTYAFSTDNAVVYNSPEWHTRNGVQGEQGPHDAAIIVPYGHDDLSAYYSAGINITEDHTLVVWIGVFDAIQIPTLVPTFEPTPTPQS